MGTTENPKRSLGYKEEVLGRTVEGDRKKVQRLALLCGSTKWTEFPGRKTHPSGS